MKKFLLLFLLSFLVSSSVFARSTGCKEGNCENGYGKWIYTDKTTYEEVCTGNTNHAEVVFLTFDEEKISYKNLVEFFYQIHDPTTLNQQGPDRGSQYRSVIAYYDDTQLEVAKQITDKLNESKFNQKITTVIEPVKNYCPAEDYHQKYMERKYSFLNF